MDYLPIYLKRLNRYGLDYKSRLQKERERVFDNLLLKSIYRIDFEYGNELIPGIFEKYKQDETETLHYLLTRVNVNIPNGTVLMIPNKDNELKPWMIYYLEHINASGYNRYIMIKMTHYLTWIARDGKEYQTWAYMYGQENNMLKDEIRSRSRMDTIYSENLKASFFVMPKTANLRKDDYIIIGEEPFRENYRVTGYDWQSTDGVGYVTIDPIYEYDLTPAPKKGEEESEEAFFWLQGGVDE